MKTELRGAAVAEVEAVLSRTSLTATAFDTQAMEGNICFVLSCGLPTAGDTKTLDVKITHCDTSDGIYADVAGAAYTQVGNAKSVQMLNIPKESLKRYVKVAAAHGSANAAYPYGVQAVYGAKYV